MDEQERREAVRRAYEYRCGYCGVHEHEAGSELEIDHFQPRSLGGGDGLDNLVGYFPLVLGRRPIALAVARKSAQYDWASYPPPEDVGNTHLVYCCPSCNRLKGDFWPSGDLSATHRRLLHPHRDDLMAHLREEADGRLIALTETGAFHIERLRLNRPPLVALRRARQESARLRRELVAGREEWAHLRERIAVLERELEEALAQLTRLSGL